MEGLTKGGFTSWETYDLLSNTANLLLSANWALIDPTYLSYISYYQRQARLGWGGAGRGGAGRGGAGCTFST